MHNKTFTRAQRAFAYAGRRYAKFLADSYGGETVRSFEEHDAIPEEDYRQLRRRFGHCWDDAQLRLLERAYKIAFNDRFPWAIVAGTDDHLTKGRARR